jgi:hypothetical protein
VDRTVADDGEAVETRPWFHAEPISRLGAQLPHAGAFGRLGVRKAPALALGTKEAGRPADPARRALLAPEYQASVRPLRPHRSAKIFGRGRSRVINARTVGKDREGMIEMAALGLLLVIVVICAVVYITGIAWLARLDVRQDESPPPETISPNLPNLSS